MNKDLTPQRAVILRTLMGGPAEWATLRAEYYGDARSASKASTSFNNQLHRMMSKDLIRKVMGGYEITEAGKALLKEGDPVEVATAKSKAQLNFEGRCPHMLVDAYNKCTQCGAEVK